MKALAVVGMLALALLLGEAAQAQEAYTSATVELRAGPGDEYPVVAVVPAGQQVWVQGCVTDYSWCDVVIGADRGWMYAGYIQSYYDYQTGYVPLLYYGAAIGVPCYPFFINQYWGRYYPNRPWFHNLNQWANHHPSHTHPRPMPYSPAAGYNGRRPGPQQTRPVAGMPQQPRPSNGMPQQPRSPHGGTQTVPHASSGMPQPSRVPMGAARPGVTITMAPVAGRPSGPGAAAPRVTASPRSSGGGQAIRSAQYSGGYGLRVR
jgi:uncharacterized protein YraI